MYNADPERIRPLSPRAYIGYGLLYLIPVFGLICAIGFAVKARNFNLRSYTRAFLISYANHLAHFSAPFRKYVLYVRVSNWQ